VSNHTFDVGQQLPGYQVRAYNAAEQSENKIHNTETARLYGFKGGLVPGVTDYAYMTRPFAEALGIAWIEHGSISARFMQPIYDGEMVTVEATVTSADDAGVTFDVVARNQAGEVCAVGTAGLAAVPPLAPAVDAVPVAPLVAERADASAESLATGTVLGTIDSVFGAEPGQADYLAQIHDDLPLYRGAAAVAHPGWTIRLANSVLVQHVRLGPWIHVSSDTQHFRAVRDGDHLSTRAVVTDVFERKGHEFVELDVLVIANGSEPVMRVAHRAIYKVRQVVEAAG
jgi:acyl dehydratase